MSVSWTIAVLAVNSRETKYISLDISLDISQLQAEIQFEATGTKQQQQDISRINDQVMSLLPTE